MREYVAESTKHWKKAELKKRMQYCGAGRKISPSSFTKLQEDIGSKSSLNSVMETIPTVRRMASSQAAPGDLLSRLRQTWIGRIYVNYLKQFSLAKWIGNWILLNAYPFYTKYLAIHFLPTKVKKWRTIAKFSDFAKKASEQIYKLAESSIIATPAIQVFPVWNQDCLASAHNRYIFPEIVTTIVRNAMLYGGTNLVLSGDEVLCHDLYDFERDYTSEELHGRTVIDAQRGRIRFLLHDKTPDSIPVAASFVDACALNYAHWMTEVLPRISLFCSDGRFRNVPVVVNDGLHQNIMESLFLAVGPRREIITVPTGGGLSVDQLYITSATGYVPFGQRTNKLTDHSHGVFSPRAFELLRNKMYAFGEKVEEQDWPAKIFLRRNSEARKVTNAAELEELMVSRGYAILEPEKMTFLQQVQLFRNAKVIFSSTGAALSNAIFCMPGTEVVVLMAKHKNMIYRYWCNMLSPMHVNVRYVLGNITEGGGLGIHSDFEVNIADVIHLLEAMESK